MSCGLERETYEHAVGFVENEVGDPPQVGGPGREEVDETAGGRDDDVSAAHQVALLLVLRRSSVDARRAHVHDRAELLALFVDLDGELSRRG